MARTNDENLMRLVKAVANAGRKAGEMAESETAKGNFVSEKTSELHEAIGAAMSQLEMYIAENYSKRG